MLEGVAISFTLKVALSTLNMSHKWNLTICGHFWGLLLLSMMFSKFTHVTVSIVTSFLSWLNNIP